MTQLAALFTWRSAISESDLSPTCRHVALAQDDPNSSRTHQELSRGARPRKRGPQPTSEQRLAIQTYVDAYASRHRGQPPPSQWRQLATRSLNALLDDGYDPTDVVAVAFALGNEGKKPTAAAHLLADRLKEPA